jgi:hypothetical protein
MPTQMQRMRELAAAKSRLKLADPPADAPELEPEPQAIAQAAEARPVAAPAPPKRARAPRAGRTAPPMPAQQPRQPRTDRKPAAAGDKLETFPHRVTLTTSYEQADDLDAIRVAENRRLREAGHEQVYTVTGLIRAAVDVCLSDPKLTARMIRAAAEPRLSGRGGIGTRRPT